MLILGRVTRVLKRPVDFDAGPVWLANGERADVCMLLCAPYERGERWPKTDEPFLTNILFIYSSATTHTVTHLLATDCPPDCIHSGPLHHRRPKS